MRPAKQMPNDEIAYHLRGVLNRGVSDGDRGFILSFFRAEKRGWPISPKQRFKAERMIDEMYAEQDYGSLVEDDHG